MKKRSFFLLALMASPALASLGPISKPLVGFKSQQVDAIVYRNPVDAIGVDPRFEPEQINPSISVTWNRDNQGHLWADVIYKNPDTGILIFKNDRFEFAERQDGDWDMVGRWSRWKCRGSGEQDWTTNEC
ncbi:MAG: hypothetical protein QUV08_11285 [Parasphingorhabdus sp.]|nr:hypothetical protein [Parasphingorhabdus sp.]